MAPLPPDDDPRQAASRKRAAPPEQLEDGQPPLPMQKIQRPQSAFRETAVKNDIWDAVDALHHKWEKQMDLHVTEVVTPESPGAACF